MSLYINIGILIVIAGLVSFGGTFIDIMIPAFMIFFGILIVIMALYLPPSLTAMIPFYLSFLGRGFTFLLLGCVAMIGHVILDIKLLADVKLAAAVITLMVAFLYIILGIICNNNNHRTYLKQSQEALLKGEQTQDHQECEFNVMIYHNNQQFKYRLDNDLKRWDDETFTMLKNTIASGFDIQGAFEMFTKHSHVIINNVNFIRSHFEALRGGDTMHVVVEVTFIETFQIFRQFCPCHVANGD